MAVLCLLRRQRIFDSVGLSQAERLPEGKTPIAPRCKIDFVARSASEATPHSKFAELGDVGSGRGCVSRGMDLQTPETEPNILQTLSSKHPTPKALWLFGPPAAGKTSISDDFEVEFFGRPGNSVAWTC